MKCKYDETPWVNTSPEPLYLTWGAMPNFRTSPGYGIWDSSGHMCSPLALVLLASYPLCTFLPWIQFHSVTEPTAVGIAPHSSTSVQPSFGLDNGHFSNYTIFAWVWSPPNSVNQWMLETNIFPDLSCFDNFLHQSFPFVRLTPNSSCSGKKEIVSEKLFNGTCYRVVGETSFKEDHHDRNSNHCVGIFTMRDGDSLNSTLEYSMCSWEFIAKD